MNFTPDKVAPPNEPDVGRGLYAGIWHSVVLVLAKTAFYHTFVERPEQGLPMPFIKIQTRGTNCATPPCTNGVYASRQPRPRDSSL